jgi:hypothetical protein
VEAGKSRDGQRVKVVGDERFERPCGVESFARRSDGSKRRRRVSFEGCVGRGGQGSEGGGWIEDRAILGHPRRHMG